MKRILVIVESIDVNDSSGSKVNVALINNLVQLGYIVKVLHYTQKEILIKNVECILIKENKFSINFLLSRTQRVLQRFFKINFSDFLENIFGHSYTFFNDTNSILKSISNNYSSEDLIITLSKGASFRPHYAMLKFPKLHSKWLAYVHDPYPFHYYPRPYNWVEKGYKFKEKFFREVSEKAKYSAFPSKLLQEWMSSYYPNFLKTGIIIPHQYNLIEAKDVKLPIYFHPKKFSLLHAGNLMKQRDPRGLINGYLRFVENNYEAKENTQLLLLGPHSYHKDYLSTLNNKEIIVEGYVDFNIVHELQKEVSVNIILESKSEISPFLPGKFPFCVTSNKPILLLSPYYSETRRLLGNNYKFFSEVDDVDKIAEHIEELYNQWKVNNNLQLNRKDLQEYIGVNYLRKQIQKLF